MHISALLTLGLALAAAASPAPTLKTKTKTKTHKPPTPTKPVEVCKAGNLVIAGGRFTVGCDTIWSGPSRYINGLQNDNTANVDLTIAGCAAACARTADCCGANFDPKLASQGNKGACRLVVRPSADSSCTPDEYHVTSGKQFPSEGNVAIFDNDN